MIAQLRLPEPCCPFWKLRSVTGCVCVVLQNLSRGSASRNPVVKLLRRFSNPARLGVAQFYAPDGRVMPEKPIAPARQQEWNRDFGIALNQVYHAALLIQASVLVLAQSIESFAIIGAKTRCQMKQVSLHRS